MKIGLCGVPEICNEGAFQVFAHVAFFYLGCTPLSKSLTFLNFTHPLVLILDVTSFRVLSLFQDWNKCVSHVYTLKKKSDSLSHSIVIVLSPIQYKL